MGRTLLSLDALESASQDWSVHVIPRRSMSRAEYLAFVQANQELRIERTAEGEVIVMPAVHSRTGGQNFEIAGQLMFWAKKDGSGQGFDSSTGFDLPNGSNRSPDVSWVLKSRIQALTPEEKKEYYPLCPDFVIELRSDSDTLPVVRAKMQEYIDNGARLGWLIDPIERKVHVYRPNRPVNILDAPSTVSGDPELPGFTLDLTPIWELCEP